MTFEYVDDILITGNDAAFVEEFTKSSIQYSP